MKKLRSIRLKWIVAVALVALQLSASRVRAADAASIVAKSDADVAVSTPDNGRSPQSSADDGGVRQVDRNAFAAAMARIHIGMGATQVRALLGVPDDIRTRKDIISTTHTKEVWRYGTEGHLSCATLGQVYIDDGDKAQYVFGGTGSPPPRGMFKESELRSLLRLIADLPRPWESGSDPRGLIRAVNAIQPLGKTKALAAMTEYLRVADEWTDHREGEFLLLRALFQLPEGQSHFPKLYVGALLGPGDASVSPLAIIQGVPFIMSNGYILAGRPEAVEEELPFFRANCALRDKPLVPTDRPLEIYDNLLKSADPGWSDPWEQIVLTEQLLYLVDTVYRPFGAGGPSGVAGPDFKTQESRIRAELGKLALRWNAKTTQYVFAKDGSTLP